MQYPKSPQRAFSIVQIGLILSVLAIVSSLAIPAWFGRSDVTLDNAAIVLARDLRNAQNRAAFEGRPTEVLFEADGSGYRVVDEHGEPLPAPIGSGDYLRSYDRDAIFRGVLIERADFVGRARAHFDSRGALVGGGRVVLRYRDESRILEIETGTGLVEIQGMSEPWVDSGL